MSSLELARDSDLLAAACDDFVIRIYDITTRKLVRTLPRSSKMLKSSEGGNWTAFALCYRRLPCHSLRPLHQDEYLNLCLPFLPPPRCVA